MQKLRPRPRRKLKPGGGFKFLHRLWQCKFDGDWRYRYESIDFRATGMFCQSGAVGLATKP